jgi:hypothetical protein
MTITVAAGQESAARAFVERMSPNARLTYSVGGTLKFELPSTEVRREGCVLGPGFRGFCEGVCPRGVLLTEAWFRLSHHNQNHNPHSPTHPTTPARSP